MTTKRNPLFQNHPLANFGVTSQERKRRGEIDIKGRSIKDDYKMANCFNDLFSTVFFSNDRAAPVLNKLENISPIADVQLSGEGIVELLLNLDCAKGTGYDKIQNAFLRQHVESRSHYIIILLRKSFFSGLLPDDYKVEKVVPV